VRTLFHLQGICVTSGVPRKRKVDARLISLINRWRSVPVHLDCTLPGLSTLRAKCSGHLDAEFLPALLHRDGSQSILAPLLEVRGDDCVSPQTNDGDVGIAVVRSGNVEVHGDGLAWLVAVYVVGIVDVSHALIERHMSAWYTYTGGALPYLALPEVASARVVVGLTFRQLQQALNISVDVARHHVVGILTTDLFELGAWLSAFWGGEVAVGVGKSCHAGSCHNGSCESHFRRW
jgi:hypothetical protein